MGAERQVSPDRPVRVMVSAGLWTAMLTCLGATRAFPFSMVQPVKDRCYELPHSRDDLNERARPAQLARVLLRVLLRELLLHVDHPADTSELSDVVVLCLGQLCRR